MKASCWRYCLRSKSDPGLSRVIAYLQDDSRLSSADAVDCGAFGWPGAFTLRRPEPAALAAWRRRSKMRPPNP